MAMKASEAGFSSEMEDNFQELLPIFKYPDETQSQSSASSMDEIIKKNSIVIQLHPKSKWVDDAYLLIGKANYYKHNYEEALTAFQYIISEYSEPKKKKGKKKKSSNENSIIERLKHQPVHNESSLWVVRTLVAMQEYNTANTALSVIKSDSKFPENLLAELYAVEADTYMKQSDFKKAIEPLIKSIELTKENATQARYHYVLAQLYDLTDEQSKAIDELKDVIALKPDYKMDFYARLKMAELMMTHFGTSAEGTTKMLSDMLKQEKYKEFYSLLYNTLAGIELKNNEKEEASEHLLKAIEYGEADILQRAYAYMRLGDIYYSDLEYVKAYNYYDSSLISLPKTEERFSEVLLRRDGLNDLVKELKIIETEKKLQYLASLNENDLEKELDKLIPLEEETNEQDFLNNTTTTEVKNTGSTFYFYDAGNRSRGYNEFKKIYGNRKLEDNWRRSDKTSSAISDDENIIKPDSTIVKTIDLSSKSLTRDALIASLPKSAEDKAASNNRIAVALYNSGVIYKQNFNNTSLAIKNFSENISDYPANTYELQSLYQMYLMSSGDVKEGYKQKILNQYPTSLFANIILDPDYLNKQTKKDAVLEDYYTSAYNKYKQDSIDAMLSMITQADSIFKTNPLKAKFAMLEALGYGKQGKEDVFVSSLQSIVKKYPNDEVGKKAKEILAAMGKETKTEVKSEAAVNYTFKKDEEQYFVAVMNGTGKEASGLKNNIANFNGTNFSLLNLKVSSLLLGKEKTLILIKSFKSIDEAMPYYNSISENADITKDVNTEALVYFLISKSNYVQFYKSKDVESYETFFEENYLNQKDK